MTSLPPDAAGRGDADRPAGPAGPNPAPVASPPVTPVAAPSRPAPAPPAPPAAPPPQAIAGTTQPAQRPPGGPRAGPRPLPPVRPSNAQVELSLDLRFTPPDKVLSRLFGALDRVGADVTLLVLLRDTPEYAGVVASAYQALRARGYLSDSARFPPGGQRLRVRRRPDRASPGLEPGDGAGPEPAGAADEPNGTPSGGPFKSEP